MACCAILAGPSFESIEEGSVPRFHLCGPLGLASMFRSATSSACAGKTPGIEVPPWEDAHASLSITCPPYTTQAFAHAGQGSPLRHGEPAPVCEWQRQTSKLIQAHSFRCMKDERACTDTAMRSCKCFHLAGNVSTFTATPFCQLLIAAAAPQFVPAKRTRYQAIRLLN